MEAAPKLPMISFDLMTCTENVHFGPQLKKYIAGFYGEDPESYLTEINNLESLRAGAVRPSLDVYGVQLLKKYYCQLHFLKSRFPMEENQDVAVQFSWKNNQLDLNYASTDVRYELMVIMYNIGALHSFLGASDSRNNPEGMKMSCTHFQCAAWAFQMVKEKYHQFVMYVSLVELVHFFQQVSLAQAQECILEKSMFDNRKPTIIAKVAVQVYSYYRQSLSILESVSEDYFRDKVYKEWSKFLHFKIAYYRCIALLFQGQQAEEQQKMGERVAYYQAASEQLEEAKKVAASLKNQHQQQEITEGLGFTQDVVEGKRKAAKNENEFIYHESVADKDQLQEVKGASLVKGIPFSINDLEVSGPDIFSRLVPMESHEAASLYSEKKAQMLRQMGELIETKDQGLAEFMSSMQLDLLTKMHQATGIPQDLIDRAAALSAKPSAVQDLINAMGKLSNIYQEVEANLNEIDGLLKAEEEAEKIYQEKIGKRPPSILATDLTREAAKYKEAHTKANDSNQTLHRAMTAHVANLKILQQPLKQLQLHLPFVELPNPNIDETSLKDLESLVAKVDEMRTQRAMLWAQLREAVHKDDITSSLVTKQPNQSLEQLFEQGLQKHQQLTTLIEQNTAAQENIKKALVDAYAKAVSTRRYIQDILHKRTSTISALMASSDTYEDLLSKANKGIEFYTKLETNVSKLLQRIKGTCKVQQEEREQVIGVAEVAPKIEDTSAPAAPKLKDFLESRKRNPVLSNVSDPSMQYAQPSVNYPVNMELPPGVRPTPLGSEITDLPKSGLTDPQNYMQYNYNYPNVPSAMPSQYGEEDLIKKMRANQKEVPTNYSQYSYSKYIPQHYNQSSYPVNQGFTDNKQSELGSPYDPSKAYTTTTNSYRSLQASASTGFLPYPDANLNSTAAMPGGYQYHNAQQPTAQSSSQYQNTQQPAPQYPNVPQSTPQYQNVPQSTPQYQNSAQMISQYQNPSLPTSQYQTPPQQNSHYQNPQQSNPQYQNPSQTASQYQNPSQTASQYQNPSQPTPAVLEPNVNTYYPYGYAPNPASTLPSTGDAQHVAGQVKYHSVEYATSVQQKLPNYNQNAFYSSPLSNMSSTNAGFYYPNASMGSNSNVGVSESGQQLTSQNSSTSYASNSSYSSNSFMASGQSYPSVGSVQADPQNISNDIPIVQTSSTYLPNQNITNALGQTYSQYYTPTSTNLSNQQPASGNQPTDNYGYSSYYTTPYSLSSQPNYVYTTPTTVHLEAPQPPSTKTSNVDLLSGLDFNISQAPLVPQQNIPSKPKEGEVKTSSAESKTNPTKTAAAVPEQTAPVEEVKRPSFKILPSKPLNNRDVKNLFNQELEKYEKFVETLTNKTLSGPTNLDIKWKEIQDQQDCDVQKKIISVARCYPMKNRYPDILPYDYSRVELCDSKDDYINASYIKDVSPYAPPFIVTQIPLAATIGDFWTMIREQQVELILCLQNDNEIGDDIYWPREKGQSINVLNMVISLQSQIIKSHWIERLISINLPEKRESRVVLHLQLTSWPGSLFPSSPDAFVSYIIESIGVYQQQKSNVHPVVVHCSSGIGRSGLVCLLTAAMLDVANNANSIPDLNMLAIKLSNCRKNILRDREHLKFAFESFLAYVRQIVSEDKMKKKLNELEPKVKEEIQPAPVVPEKNVDPLSTLDPFWASKK